MDTAEYANESLTTAEAFVGGGRQEENKDSTTEEETTSHFENDDGFTDKNVDPFVTYRTQILDSASHIAETYPSSSIQASQEQEQELEYEQEQESEQLHDLAEFAELAVARMVAEQRATILKNQRSKGNSQESYDGYSYPASEPPRIAPVPAVTKLPACNVQNDPPANLAIQPLKAHSIPLVSHDEMSDITTIPYEEGFIMSILPAEKEREHEEGDRVALVIGAGRSEDLDDGGEEGALGSTTECDARKSRWRHPVIIVLLAIFVLSAAAYLIVYVLEYINSSNEGDGIKVILANGGHSPDMIPLPGFGSKQATMMDPYRPGCRFENATQPHVLGQCICNGEISILTDEVRRMYHAVNLLFLSLNVSDSWELPENSCDPRNQAMVWVAATQASDRNDLIQKYALALFYIQMTGHEWVYRIGWLEDGDTCSWSGIDCNENGLVRDLVLDGNNLKGTLSNGVELLSNLETLSLRNNAISGQVPPGIFMMPNITEISLSFNKLTGSIPSEVEQALRLEVLLLDMNTFENEVPVELSRASRLRILNIGFNHFLGTIPLELYQLSNLEQLTLEGNARISGRLPSGIGNLTKLEVLSISHTNMQSRIPTQLGMLTNLRVLKVSNTQLSGSIPTELENLKELQHLDLSSCVFSQSIPSFFGQLQTLTYLSLHDNRLTSTIPPQLGNIAGLLHLSLHGNQLQGEIPKQLGLLSSLDTLTLQNNVLTGRAPSEVCSLRRGELIVFTTDCSDDTKGVLCPVPNCCTQCYQP